MNKKPSQATSDSFENTLLPAIKTFTQMCWDVHKWNDNPKKMNLENHLEVETLIYNAMSDCMKMDDYIDQCNNKDIIAARKLCEVFNYVINKGCKFPLNHENSIIFLHDRLTKLMEVADKKLTEENIKREKEQKQMIKLPKRRSGRRRLTPSKNFTD